MDLPTASRTWRPWPAGLVRMERLPLSLGLYLITLFLLHPAFPVTLGEINLWDEAAYINSGRMLLESRLPSIADNPLVDGVYALTYLPFQDSPFWLPQSASLGRLVAYSLLWWSAYLIARQMARFASPWLLMGIFLVTLLPLELLLFPSDALFAALAGVSFCALLRYHDTQRLRNLWVASGFKGLAVLAAAAGAGLLWNKLAVYYGAAVLLAALLVICWALAQPALARPEVGRPVWTSLVPGLTLLAAGMVIRGNLPSPVVPAWREEARERAVRYLVEHLEPGAKVAAGSPGVVWAEPA